MAHVSREELLDWAHHPSEAQIIGYATSEEGVALIRDWVIGERLYLLYSMVNDEIESRQGIEHAPGESEATESFFDFSTLPLKCTLNKRECHALAGKLWSEFSDSWYWAQPAAIRLWNTAAEAGAVLGGFGLLTTKYTNMPYVDYISPDRSVTKTAEEMFQEALIKSQDLSRHGHNSALLMNGISKLDYASLDLGMIERDMDEFGYAHFCPMHFWRGMIQAKREADAAKGRQTYADVVQEVADGVYIAPYLDEAVKRGGQFLSVDEFVVVAVEQGLDFSRGTTLFTHIINALDEQGALRQVFYERGWRQANRLGAVFFEKELLLEARSALESTLAPKRTALLDAAIKKYLGEDAVPVDEWIQGAYDYLVLDD